MSTTSRSSLKSVATVDTDPAYLNHKIKQQEIQIRSLDQQLFKSNQAQAELEARLADYNDDTDTQSPSTCDADEIGAQEGSLTLQTRYSECLEENQRMLQDARTLKGHIEELHQKVRTG